MIENLTLETLPKAFSLLSNEVSEIKRLLLERNNQTPPDTDQLLTIQQAAKLIMLSVPTVYGLVSRKAIPVSKRGKRLYFSKQELTDWIKGGRKLTISEIDSQALAFLTNQKKRG